MKTKDGNYSNMEQFLGIELTYLDIPICENKKIIKGTRIFDRSNEYINPSTKKNVFLSNHTVFKEKGYIKPIPLNKIGLLSEYLKRIKKNENYYNF
jgi:hypothetical protein